MAPYLSDCELLFGKPAQCPRVSDTENTPGAMFAHGFPTFTQPTPPMFPTGDEFSRSPRLMFRPLGDGRAALLAAPVIERWRFGKGQFAFGRLRCFAPQEGWRENGAERRFWCTGVLLCDVRVRSPTAPWPDFPLFIVPIRHFGSDSPVYECPHGSSCTKNEISRHNQRPPSTCGGYCV